MEDPPNKGIEGLCGFGGPPRPPLFGDFPELPSFRNPLPNHEEDSSAEENHTTIPWSRPNTRDAIKATTGCAATNCGTQRQAERNDGIIYEQFRIQKANGPRTSRTTAGRTSEDRRFQPTDENDHVQPQNYPRTLSTNVPASTSQQCHSNHAKGSERIHQDRRIKTTRSERNILPEYNAIPAKHKDKSEPPAPTIQRNRRAKSDGGNAIHRSHDASQLGGMVIRRHRQFPGSRKQVLKLIAEAMARRSSKSQRDINNKTPMELQQLAIWANDASGPINEPFLSKKTPPTNLPGFAAGSTRDGRRCKVAERGTASTIRSGQPTTGPVSVRFDWQWGKHATTQPKHVAEFKLKQPNQHSSSNAMSKGKSHDLALRCRVRLVECVRVALLCSRAENVLNEKNAKTCGINSNEFS